MAKGKGGGFDMTDTGNIPMAPSAGTYSEKNLGVPRHPGKTTMGESEVRKGVARSGSGGK